jgi:hypothetical protein
MLPASFEYFLHQVFLPEVPLANELDLQARLRRQTLGGFPEPVAEWLGELRIVEDPYLLSNRNDVIPPAKQIFGSVPKISIRSLQPDSHPGIIARPVWFRLCRVRNRMPSGKASGKGLQTLAFGPRSERCR